VSIGRLGRLARAAPLRRLLLEPPRSRREAWLGAASGAGLTAVAALGLSGNVVRSLVWTLLIGGGTLVGGLIDLHDAEMARVEPHGESGQRTHRNS
jgi:hypothetical protein